MRLGDDRPTGLIGEQLATTHLGLARILDNLRAERGESVPSLRIVYRWLEENEDFQQQSARARALQADTLSDLANHYAIAPMVGPTETTMEWGVQVKTGDNVARSQLIVQTLMRRAGQLAPKKYGEKIAHDHSGGLTLEQIVAGAGELKPK